MRYRVYLIDEADRIKAAETFTALDDAEALEIGAVLLRATHDVFNAYEVWCGPHRVSGASDTPRSAKRLLIEMAEERQIRTLALEERLLSSFACVRQSRELLDATAELLKDRKDQVRSASLRDQSDLS